MKIIGAVFCVLSIIIVYRKLSMTLLGKSARGVIIGYTGNIRSTGGISAYPYRVRYEYDNRVITARSLESAVGSHNNLFSDKDFNKEVTVFFRTDKPEIVTIREFNRIYIVGICMFILGLIGIFI